MSALIKVRLTEAGDPLNPTKADVIIAVELPVGYRRVFTGAICRGDLYLNRVLALDGIIKWEPVTIPTTEQIRAGSAYSEAHWFSCIIRRGSRSEQPCERCEVMPKATRCRYCYDCSRDIIRSQRGK